jgi:sterol desaturase/sphingolipid hydroxylase (fatty acid hydroxylase superfamily)
MKDQAKVIETLLEDATEYGKTSLEIVKLKALDKSSEVASNVVFQTILFVLLFSFVVFLNLGLAIWIGRLLGQLYYGFFVMAAFYLISGLIFYVFFQDKIKKWVSESIIKQVLK